MIRKHFRNTPRKPWTLSLDIWRETLCLFLMKIVSVIGLPWGIDQKPVSIQQATMQVFGRGQSLLQRTVKLNNTFSELVERHLLKRLMQACAVQTMRWLTQGMYLYSTVMCSPVGLSWTLEQSHPANIFSLLYPAQLCWQNWAGGNRDGKGKVAEAGWRSLVSLVNQACCF